MSRNFELFEGIQREGDLHAAPSLPEAGGPRAPHLLPLSGAPLVELERVVGRLFLHPSSPVPRVMAFLAMDRAHTFPWISAHCGGLLADRVAASVCLVEADPGAPSLRERLGLSARSGLMDLLTNEKQELARVVTQIPDRDIWLLPWGFVLRGEKTRVRLERLRELVNQLRARFDFVLIDAPSAGSGRDALAFAQLADAVVLTLRARSTSRSAARKLKADLDEVGANVLGTILTDQVSPVPGAVRSRF
jgi:Mrp family chromosome partitioning ATPase